MERVTKCLPEIIVTALLMAVLVLTIMYACERHVSMDAPPRLNGQPLDAHNVVEYDRPAWLNECERCYRVIDRMTGQRWWLLRIDGQWVTREDEQVDKQ